MADGRRGLRVRMTRSSRVSTHSVAPDVSRRANRHLQRRHFRSTPALTGSPRRLPDRASFAGGVSITCAQVDRIGGRVERDRWLAKFWQDNAISEKAYGFPCDDVGGYSTFIAHDNPRYMLVAIGW